MVFNNLLIPKDRGCLYNVSCESTCADCRDLRIDQSHVFVLFSFPDSGSQSCSIEAFRGVYAALYLFRGSAVFSVDLSKASVSRTAEGEVIILLPEPDAVVNINDSETELLAEYQRKFFNGNADDGFQAFLNSLRMINTIALDKVSNYDVLMDMAMASARKQAEMLASGVCIDCRQITVLFRTES